MARRLAWTWVMLIGTGLLCTAMAAFGKAAGPTSESVTEIHGYQAWTRVNPKPYHVSHPAAALCAAASRQPISPHDEHYITVYVNGTARHAMLEARKPEFPVGSVIVKEKRAGAAHSALELMTVMEKKPRGFDPRHGDWQYSIFDSKGKLYLDAKVDQCQTCHEKVNEADYVFRGYLPKNLRTALK